MLLSIGDFQGGPPEPWEVAVGDAMDRVSRQGRAVIDYATRMNEMGIHEQSLAGDFNPIAEHVASVGRDKMRLLPGGSARGGGRIVAALDGDGGNGSRRCDETATLRVVHEEMVLWVVV